MDFLTVLAFVVLAIPVIGVLVVIGVMCYDEPHAALVVIGFPVGVLLIVWAATRVFNYLGGGN